MVVAMVASMVGCVTGCASQAGPEKLLIATSEYERVFVSAIEVARRESLVGGLRDRRTGVIETEPEFAPTILEPWHAGGEPSSRLMESTISFQRRRARFEFSPHPLADVGEAVDLTRYEGELDLRVFVHVDRMHTVGRRRSTWSRRVSSIEEVLEVDESVTRRWVPAGRDTAMERRLLAALQTALSQ